jgi:hypothetical protein
MHASATIAESTAGISKRVLARRGFDAVDKGLAELSERQFGLYLRDVDGRYRLLNTADDRNLADLKNALLAAGPPMPTTLAKATKAMAIRFIAFSCRSIMGSSVNQGCFFTAGFEGVATGTAGATPPDKAPSAPPDADGTDAAAAAWFLSCSSLCLRFAVLRSSSTSSPGPLRALAPRIDLYVSSS